MGVPKFFPVSHFAHLRNVVKWAEDQNKRWVFTNSNAGSKFFNDFADLNQLDQIDWNAVKAKTWTDCWEKKQAEFLLKGEFPWHLVEGIGVYSQKISDQVIETLSRLCNQGLSCSKKVMPVSPHFQR